MTAFFDVGVAMFYALLPFLKEKTAHYSTTYYVRSIRACFLLLQQLATPCQNHASTNAMHVTCDACGGGALSKDKGKTT